MTNCNNITNSARQEGTSQLNGSTLSTGNLDLRSFREILRAAPPPPSLLTGLGLGRSEKLSPMEAIDLALQIVDDGDITLEPIDRLMDGSAAASKILQKKQ